MKWTCKSCGKTAKVPDGAANVFCSCGAKPPPGMGDRLATLLAAVGLTQQRYIQAKRLFGLAPKCGCNRRKAWLNRVGAWLSR